VKVVELSGGVGGAKLARGLDRLSGVDLTVIVNVGDDETNHGLHVSPDLDTVVYTLAGMEGEQGWGRGGDTFVTNDELSRFGMDNTFKLGDKDLALKLYRSERMRDGDRLSEITNSIAEAFEIDARVLPATDDRLRTEVGIDNGQWITFQDYFVFRGHRDEVQALRFSGAEVSVPAPGVMEAIDGADTVLIGPSNPPLSIWPILAIPGIRPLLAEHPRVIAVSPLFGGKALKGPADRVMASLGLAPGNAGVAEAYVGAIDMLVIDSGDSGEIESIDGVEVRALDTRIPDGKAAAALCEAILGS
jgi:LPPG:FO 2-phospho-L-lactate transferase